MTASAEVHDPYIDPQTGVLWNRLGIADPATLAEVEADLTTARAIWLADHPIPGSYDLAHLRTFHHLLFGDIYEWAGELRTVRIAKTDLFCMPQFLESNAAQIFEALRDEAWLCNLSHPQFVERLAYHLGEVNALHPFREGNGRAQRAFFAQLSRDAGWEVRWSRLDGRTNDNASRASLQGDLDPLRALLNTLVEPA
jgi:cell filamentation protein